MSDNSGKTVEVKELPSKAIRLFEDRESFTVAIPQSVQDTTENCPVTVSITPMSHRDAEVRKRIKKALTVAMSKSNRIAGITAKDVQKYNEAFSDVLANGNELSEEEHFQALSDFQDDWDWFKAKVDSKDLTEYYAEEDRLHDNALEVIAKNVVSLNWGDSNATISRENVECLHPDLISWLLVQIESNSYLTEGEITGF